MVLLTKTGMVLIPYILVIIAATFTFVISQESNMGEVGPYFVSEFQLSWEDSRKYCGFINKTLISIETVEKDKALVSTFQTGNATLPGNAWTSGREVIEGVWNWDTGVVTPEIEPKPFYYTRWFVGQPNVFADISCVYLANSALLYWRDANCSAAMYFICE